MFINYDYLLILIFCYLVGSIPFGLLISMLLKKEDPRLIGSKNIGATNIARTSGWKLGLLTLICDVLKGFLPLHFFKNYGIDPTFIIIFLFIGHLFPLWLKFKGGKGIAVIIGCLLAYKLSYGMIFSVTWIFVAIVSKYSSLSALVASLISLIIIFFDDKHFFYTMSFIVFMIFIKHYDNIKRLLDSSESKIILKKKK